MKKIICILNILKKYSDENHALTASEIIEKMNSLYYVNAERKSVYRDIEVLAECGYNVAKAGRNGFYLAERNFEPAEIRLLNDAVLSARFIPPKITRELSEKLRTELSIYQAKQIESQTYFDHRVKYDNEQIMYIIDTIHKAICERRKITFDYFRKKIENSQVCRVMTRSHIVSPYALVWSDEKYYLVGNYEKYNNISHYRLDRMENVAATNEPARYFEEVSEYKNMFDIGDYVSRVFQMYSGEEEEIILLCKNELLEKMIDKFGDNVRYVSCGEEHFRLKAKCCRSEGLVEWLMMFGNRCAVISPESLRNDIVERAKSIISFQNNMSEFDINSNFSNKK